MDHSEQAVSIFNKYAREYEGKFMDVSLYAESFKFFCATIKKKNADILELACGPGNISKFVLKQRPDFSLLGTDLAPNMIALAQENNPNAKFQVMDARTFGKLNKTYDGIICGFCLPYLSIEESKKMIMDAHNMLQKEGLLYLSTMEDDYSASGPRKGSQGDEIFMHFYKEEDLQRCLEEAHLEPVYVDRVITEMTNGNKVIDLVIIAKK